MVAQMGDLPVSLYSGALFDKNVCRAGPRTSRSSAGDLGFAVKSGVRGRLVRDDRQAHQGDQRTLAEGAV